MSKKKALEVSLKRSIRLHEVELINNNGVKKVVILQEYNGVIPIQVSRCDELGFPTNSIRNLIRKGRLNKYYPNGRLKTDNRKTTTAFCLNEWERLKEF